MLTEDKLDILTDSGKYDLACSCKFTGEAGRKRGDDGKWIYPAALPNGQKIFLLKTLMSNECINDCSYCPFNNSKDVKRCSLNPEELSNVFMKLVYAKRVSGLFLSSGISCSPDLTMDKMIATVKILRKRYRFRGFIHLKIIPGCSDEAIRQAVNLATRVSINIEAPNEHRLQKLSKRKHFKADIIEAFGKINRFSHELGKWANPTTQFVVGAAGESDKEIVTTTESLYKDQELARVYYSAFQSMDSEKHISYLPELPLFANTEEAKKVTKHNQNFIREHRLYQTDYLMRKYGFSKDEIYYEHNGNLSLEKDPKEVWAINHPDIFPININSADREILLRVPGIGPDGANKVIKARRESKLKSVSDIKALISRHKTASQYLKV